MYFSVVIERKIFGPNRNWIILWTHIDVWTNSALVYWERDENDVVDISAPRGFRHGCRRAWHGLVRRGLVSLGWHGLVGWVADALRCGRSSVGIELQQAQAGKTERSRSHEGLWNIGTGVAWPSKTTRLSAVLYSLTDLCVRRHLQHELCRFTSMCGHDKVF